jgi:hypothetical protein
MFPRRQHLYFFFHFIFQPLICFSLYVMPITSLLINSFSPGFYLKPNVQRLQYSWFWLFIPLFIFLLVTLFRFFIIPSYLTLSQVSRPLSFIYFFLLPIILDYQHTIIFVIFVFLTMLDLFRMLLKFFSHATIWLPRYWAL